MAGYIVADIEITDLAEYQTYSKQVAATIERYSGKFLVRGGDSETLEGDWKTERLVILEFPSVEQAKNWYDSPEYSAIKGIRHRSAISNILLVQGA